MGNTALRKWQIGIESQYGQEANAARKLYPGTGSGIDKTIAFHTPELDMGSYDAAGAGRFAQLVEAGGSISDMVLDTNMIIELLRMAISATPATGTEIDSSGAYLWEFGPGDLLASATIEFDASGQVFVATGCMVDELSFSWSVSDSVAVSASVISKDISKGSLTTALSDFTLVPIQGWEAQLFIAAAGIDPFTTQAKAATLIGGEIGITNALSRRYFDDNTNLLSRLNRGRRSVEAALTLDLSANAMAEYDNWEAGIERTVGLRFGNNIQAGTSELNKHKVDITLPGIWTSQKLGDEDDASTLELTLENVYNQTLGGSFSISVVNTRDS
jgi:hypothetical protein